MPLSAPITCCRACGAARLAPVLDLGEMPLANALLRRDALDEAEPRFPLAIVFCHGCALMQLTETVRPDVLFGQYLYASSYSDTLLRHAEAIADDLTSSRRLNAESLVVEVASNDGYLLQYFQRRGIPVLGIEPAENIAALAGEKSIPTRAEFFSADLGRQLAAAGVRADVVIGNNVLAHVADINGFLEGVAAICAPGGVAQFEFPYVVDLVDKLEFDTIYHEHVFYYSAHAIDALLRRHGLVFTDVERLPIHGGSLRVRAAFGTEPTGRRRVEALLAYERARGVHQLDFYAAFAAQVEALTGQLRQMLGEFKSQGKRIAAYGASAKGAVLLNYLALEPATIAYVVDRSALKQGRFTPGTRLEIFPPERLVEDHPDVVLLLTWNFADEILAQQRAYLARGGQFLFPLPEPCLYPATD